MLIIQKFLMFVCKSEYFEDWEDKPNRCLCLAFFSGFYTTVMLFSGGSFHHHRDTDENFSLLQMKEMRQRKQTSVSNLGTFG